MRLNKSNLLTRVLASAGTVLAWTPLLIPILLSLIVSVQERMFLFDYLMPAELFPVALVGGVLLLWAAWRACSRRKLIGWGLGIAVATLVGSQMLAVVTGLASGETPPGGAAWALVVGLLGVYWLALIAVAVGGLSLLRDLTRRQDADKRR